MGGCLCVEQSVQNRLIPDVEQIIADRVWTEFVASSHRFKSLFMRRRDYKIEVPMNFYHFEELSQTLHPMDHLQVINNAASKAMTHASSNLEGKQLAHQDKTSPEDNRLQTTFCNDTDKDQTYSFKFEKTRKASITITQHKGFSFGGKASFSVDLAKMPGVEIDARYDVTKDTGDTFEETLTTTASSDIAVSSHSTCTATVVMEERHLRANFEVTVKMSMPEGRAEAFVRNKRGERVFAKEIRNLSFLFDEEHHMLPEENPTLDSENPSPPRVIATTERGTQTVESETLVLESENEIAPSENQISPCENPATSSKETQTSSVGRSPCCCLWFDREVEFIPSTPLRPVPLKDAVKFEVHGIVEGRLLSSHHISLQSWKIPERDPDDVAIIVNVEEVDDHPDESK